jgi:hypothetical protein
MRVLRFLPLLLLFCYPVLAQTTASPAPQDPQAVSVLNQALAVGGGLTAIKAIADYTGSGNITYHWNPDVQGTVTIKGLGSIAIRLDATLPSGVRSWAIHDGQTAMKQENGAISQLAATNPNVPSSDAFPYQTPLFPSSIAFPYHQLTTVLANPSFGISYKGIVQVDGHSVHDIQVQRVAAGGVDPMSKYHAREFFIDTSTFQIVMTQDLVPKNVIHQIHYSNYTAVSGVLVPFAIAEELGGQATWTIQLSQMTFNPGLQDSDFVLQ